TENNVLSRSCGSYDVVTMSNLTYYQQLYAALSSPKTGSYADLEKLFSVFGRINYNYDERYLLSATLRRDESSKFNPQYNTGYFPSFSAGWRISNEEFFNVSWIDDLKLRANYGILGTSNIGVWDWVAFITSFPQAVFGTGQSLVTGMTQIRLANPDLKWEKLSQINAGFDAALLGGRLEVSTDY